MRPTVYLYGDSNDEPDETFSIVLSGATGALLNSLSEILVTILDNDETGGVSQVRGREWGANWTASHTEFWPHLTFVDETPCVS